MNAPAYRPQELGLFPDQRLSSLKDAIQQQVIVASDEQRIVSPDGREHKWLLDLRPVLLNGRSLTHVAELFWERFAPSGPFQICGLESAAIPLLSAIAIKGERRGTPVNAFIVRKERKTSGLAREIEGRVDDTPIVVVDDLTNSSESLEKVRVVLAGHGKRLSKAFVVVDFESERSQEWRTAHAIGVDSLFQQSDLRVPVTPNVLHRPAHRFEPLWTTAAPGANHFLVAPRSSPISDGRSIYVGTDGGALRAIDVATGAELWHFQVEAATRKGIWSSPALAEGKVLFGAYNGSLYCLDTMTGAEIWHANPADWIGSSPIVSSRYGLVLVGLEHALPGAEGSVAAFDLETGSKVWEHPVSEFIHASPTLSADEEQVFVGTNGGDFICLDTASGALRWRHRAEGAFKAAAAVSAIHKTVVVGSFDQCIYLLESSTGRTIATVKTGGSIYASPLILGDAAYIGSLDKNLYVIDLIDGTVIKRIALGARILATPVLLDGLIYVGTTGGRLLGIDPASLAVRETLQLPDRIVNPPLLLQGGSLLVVPVTGNRLLGFGVSRTDYSEPQQGAFVAGQVPAPKPVPLSAPIVDAARPEGLFYRIDEPSAQAIARPYRSIPSRRLLGAASLLAIHSPNYRDLPLAEVGRRLLPPLVANQARVFLYGIQPIGLVTWAFLNEQSEQELAANSKLPELADWSNGDRPWIIDVVAPFGSSRAMLDKVRREALRGQTVKLLERAPDGSLRTTTLHP